MALIRMHRPIHQTQKIRVPPLIKRNTTLFALSQSFTGAGMQFAYGLGPLMVIALSGSAGLAGLSVGLIALSRFMVAYPIGKITDTFGRKPGILLGLSLALVGALVVGFSMNLRSIVMLVAGILFFGMGMNAAQQLRVAATDMFPSQMRAQALGFVALGSLAGLILSPLIVNTADKVAKGLGQDPLGLPWLMLPILIVPGMFLVTLVRPDPKHIGMNLAHYYPDYVPPARTPGESSTAFSALYLLRYGPTRLAIASNCAGQGNMAIIMVLTSLVLHHHGHSLTAIAFSHVFHTAGMFAFTIPLGWLADRIGRVTVMIPGVAVTLIGAIFVTYTEGYWLITLGTFLVGLGWAGANVAATAMIADHAHTEHRGRAIGLADSFAGGISVLAAAVTGPLIDLYGLSAAGLTAVLVAAVPLVLLPTVRLRQVI